jgi:AcrR family transcriptional regulator
LLLVANLRDLNKARRRDEILAATGRLVASQGVDALSMRKLAEAAGLSVATLYNLFGSRDLILIALVERGMDQMEEALEAAAPANPLARGEAVVTVTIDYFTERAAVYQPVWLAQRHTEGERSEGRSLTERAADMQRVALRAAVDEGLLHGDLDTTLLGMQIFEGWARAADLWAAGVIDAKGFKSKALHSLYICLLSVATDATRPLILEKTRGIEQTLRLALSAKHASRVA